MSVTAGNNRRNSTAAENSPRCSFHVVTNTQPVQFWFQKTDGSWWYWGSLGPGNWDLSNYAVDVMQVRIRGADSATSTPTIANIVIRA